MDDILVFWVAFVVYGMLSLVLHQVSYNIFAWRSCSTDYIVFYFEAGDGVGVPSAR